MTLFDYRSLEQNCLLEMSQNGTPFSGPIITNGKVHRFSADFKKNKKDEWYIAWSGISQKGNAYLICQYGSWNPSVTLEIRHIFKSWHQNHLIDGEELQHLQSEVQQKQALIAKAMQEAQNAAAIEATRIWEECKNIQPTERHLRYCYLKQINPFGVRFGNNPNGYPSVIIPLRNTQGDIRSLQFISVGDNGSVFKTFLTEGEKRGNFFHFGNLVNGHPIAVAEGYATGYSIFEGHMKNQALVVAFDCHNLGLVIEKLKQAYPTSPITICGDDDVESEGNAGRSKAEAVAKKFQCNVLFPTFPSDFKLPNGKKPTDFNDLHVHFGIDQVRIQLTTEQPQETTIISDKSKKRPTTLQFRYAHTLIQEPPKANWLLKSYLDAGSLSVLFGEPESMKSFLAIDIGYSIVTGIPWHGIPVKTTGPVFYIAGEGFYGLSRRLRAWSLAHHVDLNGLPFFISDRPAQLLDSNNAQKIVERMEELHEKHGQPVLVIIDTLNRNFGPGDENHTQDMTAFINSIDSFIRAKYECAVLIVHHTPLGNSGRARGASALRGALDWEYSLSKQNGDVKKLSATKVKDYEAPPDIYFKPKSIPLDGWIDEEDGEIMTSCVLEKIDNYNSLDDKPKTLKLTPPQKLAFNCLLELYQSSDCDKSTGVHINNWRDRAYKEGISPTGGPSAKTKAFARAVDKLRELSLIEVNNDFWKPGRTMDRDRTNDGHVLD